MSYLSFLAIYKRLLSEANIALMGNNEASKAWIINFNHALNNNLWNSIIINAIFFHPYSSDWTEWISRVGIFTGALEHYKKDSPC